VARGGFVNLEKLDGLLFGLKPVDPHDGALARFHLALVAVAGGSDLGCRWSELPVDYILSDVPN